MSSRRAVFLVLFLIVAASAVSIGGLLLIAAFSGGGTPTVASNSTLYLKLRAPLNEAEPDDVVSQFIRRRPTLRATIDQLKKAKTDDRIRGLVIRPDVDGALWAQLQELRAGILDFRAGGKPVTAFLESGGSGAYYLASAADRIVMMPAGQLDLAGTVSHELFFRGTLDKAGVYPDMLHIGDYKTASNTFTEKGFTPAHREMTRSLNRDWHDELVKGVAGGRKMAEPRAREVLEGGPYLAEGAHRAGLVDELAYEDELARREPIQGTVRLDGEQYESVPARQRPAASGGRIALLYAVGVIASGESSFDSTSGAVVGSETFTEWLRKVRVDPSIRAVVVRVDSPGGSAIASEVIWRELMLTRDVKPVVVSMGDVAASGGYYIAAPADAVLAQPGTLTGSIGVVTGKFVVRDALGKLGVTSESVGEGPMAEISSPFRPFTPAERARVEEQMQATYELFLKRVADGRRVSTDRIDAVAQGRVWTGRQAREVGLVDELGGLEDAIRVAVQRAKLDPARRVDLDIYPKRRSFYELLANPFGSVMSAALPKLIARPDVRALERTLSTLDRFRRGEPLALMPNVFWR